MIELIIALVIAIYAVGLFVYLPGAILWDLVVNYNQLKLNKMHNDTRKKMIKMNLGDKKWQKMKRL